MHEIKERRWANATLGRRRRQRREKPPNMKGKKVEPFGLESGKEEKQEVRASVLASTHIQAEMLESWGRVLDRLRLKPDT